MKKLWSRLQRLVKEEKGLTLIELLAVIVILGIIAAIAVPAITGITNNTKQEAHKANAHQMIEAAKQMVAINSALKFSDSLTEISATTLGERITLAELKADHYFPEGIKDPTSDSGNNYDESNSAVLVTKDSSGVFKYYVSLYESKATNPTRYFLAVPEANVDKTTPGK